MERNNGYPVGRPTKPYTVDVGYKFEKTVLDKFDKEILFEYIWKLISFFYAIMIIISVLIGIITIIYILEGMVNKEISQNGLIKVWILVISYIILRNLIKPFFMRKMSKI